MWVSCTLVACHAELIAALCSHSQRLVPAWSEESQSDSVASEMLVVHFICVLSNVSCKRNICREESAVAELPGCVGVRSGKLSFWPTNCTLLVSSAQYFLCFAGNDIFQWILQRLQITNEGA